MTLIDMQMSFFIFIFFCLRPTPLPVPAPQFNCNFNPNEKKSRLSNLLGLRKLSNSSDDKVHHFNIGRMLLGMFRDSKRCFYKTFLKKKNIYKTKWVKVALIVIKIRRGNGTEGHRITASLIGCL